MPARWPGGPWAEMSASVTTSLGWRTQSRAPYAVTAPSEVANPLGHLAPDRAPATPAYLGICPLAARLRRPRSPIALSMHPSALDLLAQLLQRLPVALLPRLARGEALHPLDGGLQGAAVVPRLDLHVMANLEHRRVAGGDRLPAGQQAARQLDVIAHVGDLRHDLELAGLRRPKLQNGAQVDDRLAAHVHVRLGPIGRA